jgi:5-methylcytosine-specific restriction endonuclease McrA
VSPIKSFCHRHGLIPRGPCRECIRERDRRRGSSSRRGYGSEWRRVRAAVLERDGHTCTYCGQPANHVDHVVPRSKGGTDDLGNLVSSCEGCNKSKGGSYGPGRLEEPREREEPRWLVI